MKVIFLDIDGVLNYQRISERAPSGCIGISDTCCERLARIVAVTDAKLVLTSTWKRDWQKGISTEELPRDGQYLVNKLLKHRLTIYDKTVDPSWAERGVGIINYLSTVAHPVDSFIILDDERYDFKEQGLADHLVQTQFSATDNFDEPGLQDKHVRKAVRLLNDSKS